MILLIRIKKIVSDFKMKYYIIDNYQILVYYNNDCVFNFAESYILINKKRINIIGSENIDLCYITFFINYKIILKKNRM